ncbi:MAG: AAA family ATPase [Clostridia bacterium]|nr:AAA family ATPase [Clostridia bacterium]
MNYGQIIVLNGTSSSGKSTLARTIQELSEERYYHLQLDTMCNMMHPKFFEKKDDFLISMNSAMKVMNPIIFNLSGNGEYVIVDTVLENPGWLKDCVEVLHDLPVTFVKVNCPPEELERREAARGDRMIGLARYQYEIMDFVQHYDIEVNTYENTPEECAAKILHTVKSAKSGNAFSKIYEDMCG